MNTNNLKTVLLLGGLGGLLVAFGRIFGGSGGMVIGLGFAILMSGGAYWFSDKLAIRSAGARELAPGELPQLRQMVSELATAADIPMPRLYIAPSPQPNAFATGRNPKHAAVAVTSGILEVLEPYELKAVLAHELSHVKNRDILLTSVAAVFGSAISMLANFLPWSMFSSNDDDRPNPFLALLLAIVAPLAALIMQMALSRSREFQADASGAHLLHSGDALASALMKIDAYAKAIPMQVDPSQASAYIINPLGGLSMAKLFSTHPSTEERVARLRTMSGSVR